MKSFAANSLLVTVLLAAPLPLFVHGDEGILKTHCADCHTGRDPEGEFQLSSLAGRVDDDNIDSWVSVLDRVIAEEMPPADSSELSPSDRKQLVGSLKQRLRDYKATHPTDHVSRSRRMNNREFRNSISDVLLIEDVGTHLPTANLIGDSLHEGFDTHAETLGFSRFHLEQYIHAVRKIVDATILSGNQPASQRYEIGPTEIFSAHTSQNTTRPERQGLPGGFDFLDPQRPAYFSTFKTAPHTGRYKISIRCIGKDRGVYPQEATGMYDDDPIRLTVNLGDRQKIFELPDETIHKIELDEWIAAGSRVQMAHPTDGLRLRGNGNFKFQNAITGEYIKQNQPDLYARVVEELKTSTRKRVRPRQPQSWHNWVDYWRGPRPQILDVVIEGPFFQSWPPKRQAALLGENPTLSNAEEILTPIAERAWRRKLHAGELDQILTLVQSKAGQGDVEALKEGVVAILVSHNFLLLNQSRSSVAERTAEKISFFLSSAPPNKKLREDVGAGQLDSFSAVRAEVQRRLAKSEADEFLRAFPFAWLKLSDINFMAPDPERFRHYHRKRVSEDMVDEVLHFFKHAVNNNMALPEFLSADYSFVNADLAEVYGLDDVPNDSKFRKYTFKDGRRGGLLGMGAVLTVTADSLATSPIHRAVYVMENFLGIHPTPPPPDVQITEPDVRAAKTIREVLDSHRSDPNCASCHQRIDPFGYAFENFDPSGAWRENYTIETTNSVAAKTNRKRRAAMVEIPIDASASFRSGAEYSDIVEYRKHLLNQANRDRFVRCFITKLLTYANGVEPHEADFADVDAILEESAANGYRIVDTIAAVIDSPLFRPQPDGK